jgi:serine phosphatase RsbU (regulator of sigma subunit)
VLRLTLFVPTPTQLHEENNLALKKDLQECMFLAQFYGCRRAKNLAEIMEK